mmetsp:Transcript_37458/g.85154  ORF Transcript_37458/g.85154 Transcript_37458/m.85154 type:complete len:205 (-) Transcript_37458:257-871(-)
MATLTSSVLRSVEGPQHILYLPLGNVLSVFPTLVEDRDGACLRDSQHSGPDPAAVHLGEYLDVLSRLVAPSNRDVLLVLWQAHQLPDQFLQVESVGPGVGLVVTEAQHTDYAHEPVRRVGNLLQLVVLRVQPPSQKVEHGTIGEAIAILPQQVVCLFLEVWPQRPCHLRAGQGGRAQFYDLVRPSRKVRVALEIPRGHHASLAK